MSVKTVTKGAIGKAFVTLSYNALLKFGTNETT